MSKKTTEWQHVVFRSARIRMLKKKNKKYNSLDEKGPGIKKISNEKAAESRLPWNKQYTRQSHLNSKQPLDVTVGMYSCDTPP